MPDSDPFNTWGSSFLDRLDAMDRDGWSDPEEMSEFETRLRNELAGRARTAQPSSSALNSESRVDKGRDRMRSATIQARVSSPPSSLPLFSDAPLPSSPPGPVASNATSVTSISGLAFSESKIHSISSDPTRDLDDTTNARTPTRTTASILPPTVQTPVAPPPLPPPPVAPTTPSLPKAVTQTLDTPVNIQTPSPTPGSVGSRPRGDPATPVRIATNGPVGLGNTRQLQNLSKIYEQFSKSAQLEGVKPPNSRGRGRGRGRQLAFGPRGTSTTSMLGLGGSIFQGLRFVIASEKRQVQKHKQYLEVITKLGGTVVLEPDNAITHVIYDPGRNASAAMLAHELGISSLSDLPVGTVCVKYDWVAQCKIARRLLDTEPWLSFPLTTLTRVPTMNGPKLTRMEDITDQLVRRSSGAIRRKRDHTPSGSDTESSLSQRRAPPQISSPDNPGPSKRARLTNDAATRHSVTPGPGWVEARSGEEDGLDVMIMGVVNGSVEDEVSEGSTGSEKSDDDDDDTGNPNPMANRFKCGQKHDGTGPSGPNEWLAKEFDKLHSLYEGERGKNEFAIRGYQRTAGILRRTLQPIISGAQARKIKGIGENMALRIDEFLSGAKGRAYYENTDKARTVAMFKDIYGVGKSFANELYQRGARTIEDLHINDYGLSNGQKIGVELYDDLNSRIPRDECRELFEKIRAAAIAIEPKLWIEIMGSYRRGQETSGDVDVLITRDTSDGKTHAGVLRRLIQMLQKEGVITHDLSVPHEWGALEAKWMGVGRVSDTSKHRRIDILCIPYDQWGAALLYFTGNEVFNRSMRLYARKKGYSLNQRGLFRGVMRDRKGTKMTEGEVIASRTEQEIFDALGIRWREPQHRRP